MSPQKGVGMTPASVTFRLPDELNKQMQSVVYVQKCRDRNVPRPKRPRPKRPRPKRLRPKRPERKVLFRSHISFLISNTVFRQMKIQMKSCTKAKFHVETIAVIIASYGNIVYTSNVERWADIILWPVSLLWWKSRKCVMFSVS